MILKTLPHPCHALRDHGSLDRWHCPYTIIGNMFCSKSFLLDIGSFINFRFIVVFTLLCKVLENRISTGAMSMSKSHGQNSAGESNQGRLQL